MSIINPGLLLQRLRYKLDHPTLPHVSVVIPAYNEETYLPLCLQSVKNQDYAGTYEIIVVDNASTDNTASIASASGAKVIHEGKRSPSCARQKGLEAADGDIVAFIDADTQAPAYWLSSLVSRLIAEPETVVLSGPYAFFDAGAISKVVSYATNFVNISLDHLFRKALKKGGALWGCNFAVRRSALLAAGGFDTSIKLFGEDYELSLRLRSKGKAGLLPWLFVLTSARRLKEQGLLTTYWNYIIDYFSVLFWSKPIPERLVDWPAKTWQAFTNGRTKIASRSLINVLETIALGAFFAYTPVNPAFRVNGKVWSHGSRTRRHIALTFDDGPNEPYTSQILEILNRYGIKATFFVIGANVRRSPEICRRALAAGHVLGNHSYHHGKSLWLQSELGAARELYSAQRVIHALTGYQVGFFRPPYGYGSRRLIKTARRLGYAVITWDNMTSDWKESKPAGEIYRSIIKRARPGGIVVLHDGRSTRASYDCSQMIEALPIIIETLRSKGFEFVTIPELFRSTERN